LPESLRAAAWYRPYVGAIVAAIFIEYIWLCAASIIAVRSHFNYDHAFFLAVYPLMGLIAIFLTSISLVYGAAILQNAAAPVAVPMRYAVGIGLILTCVLTVIVASTLSVGGQPFGGSPNGAGIPLFGWRRDGPDLRIAHFFATHAMHILPVAAWLFTRTLPEKIAINAVLASSGLYSVFVASLFFYVIRTAN
jgi:hypothetical protein